MVLLEHLGYGFRDRPLWLYFWDARDGADFSGWWITPDYIGNNDYILRAHDSAGASAPSDVAIGGWRSPIIEQGLRRSLNLGFRDGGGGRLLATGSDVAVPLVPDGACRIDLSKLAWVPDGMNHGRPAFQAQALPPSASAAWTTGTEGDGQAEGGRGAALRPAVAAALGVLAGAAIAAFVMRRR